jgi:hypothetical protein
MSAVPHIVPSIVQRAIRAHRRRTGLSAEQQAERTLALADAAGLPEAAARSMVRAQSNAGRVDRTPSVVEARQRELVRLLCSGGRVSVNRCWRLAGYHNHHASLDQILRSAAVVRLFRDAVAEGKTLPVKYAARIEAAIQRQELGII